MKPPLSNKLKGQLKKVFWITIIWTFISLFQLFAAYTSIIEMDCDLGDKSLILFVGGSILVGLMAGILGGSGIVFLWERWLRTKKYGLALFYIFLSYSILYLIVDFTSGLYKLSHELGLWLYDLELWKAQAVNSPTIGTLYSFVFWLIVVLGTLVVLQVNDKYGPGVFGAFLMGKYFQPKREERIFMFLDLRSSTTIAEKLGEARYFNFIKDVFKDATPAILYAKGEIYQYIGDEIVVSWQMNNGIENANCIQCFFDVQTALYQKQAYYNENYDGVQPEFKAGLHYGHVMAGEVGVVKRDIAFSGDVLNTAARIQSKCNDLGVNILFSKYLLDKLALTPSLSHPKKIGDMLLRGKEQKVILYTL